MQQVDLLATFVFAFITTFTPGPNTISSGTMGLNWGYRKSLPYFFGIATGFFGIMVLSSTLAVLLESLLPSVVTYVTIAGAAYILYLAWHIRSSSYVLKDSPARMPGYLNGLVLQLLNPKVSILGLTVYTTFLREMPRTTLNILVSTLFFTGLSFSALSTWALCGTAISTLLKDGKKRNVVNTILALALVYMAIKLVIGLIPR